MDINQDKYRIVFTNDCIKEMESIYNYISKHLDAESAAKNLMQDIENSIRKLVDMPKTQMIIKKFPKLDLEYRRIVVNNYIILYTISEQEKTIYIVHMYYGRSDYLKEI